MKKTMNRMMAIIPLVDLHKLGGAERLAQILHEAEFMAAEYHLDEEKEMLRLEGVAAEHTGGRVAKTFKRSVALEWRKPRNDMILWIAGDSWYHFTAGQIMLDDDGMSPFEKARQKLDMVSAAVRGEIEKTGKKPGEVYAYILQWLKGEFKRLADS